MSEVERLADQMVLLDKGHVVAVGPLAELQADPNSMLATSQEAALSLRGVIEDVGNGIATLSFCRTIGCKAICAITPPSTDWGTAPRTYR